MGQTCVSMEITSRCKNCGDAVAINAIVDRIYCTNCSGELIVSSGLWSLFSAEIEGSIHEMHIGEQKSTEIDDQTTGTVRLIYQKTHPQCQECNHLVDYGNIENDKIICRNCNCEILKRKSREFKDNKNVKYCLGEDPYQISEAKKKSIIHEPEELECNNCGGILTADGKKRIVVCTYCNTNVVIQDKIWNKLHPSANIRPWYVFFQTTDTKLKPWTFAEINDIYKAEDDIIYCLGNTKHGDKALWAMTLDNKLIWMKLLTEQNDSYFDGIELLADEKLLLLENEKNEALIYDCKTGNPLGKMGGREPDDAKKHYFDLKRCKSLATDPNGTIVILIHNRILRYSSSGEGIPTWPEAKNIFGFKKNQKLKSIYKYKQGLRYQYRRYHPPTKYVKPHKLKDYSTVYSRSSGDCKVQVDNEGSMYLLGPVQVMPGSRIKSGGLITKFDKTGKIVFKTNLNIAGLRGSQPEIDSEGYIYIILNDIKYNIENNGVLLRVSPDGKEVKTIIRTSYHVLNPLSISFTVDNDGNIYTFSELGEMRIYNSAGQLIQRNEEAQAQDKNRIN